MKVFPAPDIFWNGTIMPQNSRIAQAVEFCHQFFSARLIAIAFLTYLFAVIDDPPNPFL